MTHHWSQVIENKEYKTSGLSLSGKKNVLIRNCDFSVNKSDGTMFNLSNCQDCTIEDCKFHDKDTLGVALKIAGGKTKRITVKGCEFYNLTYSSSNGGEPIRVGNSHSSGCWFDSTIENCYFHDLAADPETVSIKCCGVTVRNCRHENNKSSFVIRHGGFATIQNNRFKGEGGIRIYGYGNVIEGNHFQDNQSTKFPPLTLGAGNVAVDPNFTAVDKPSGKDTGKSHANYAQINNNKIRNNTYKNCKRTIYVRTDKNLKAINSTIEPLKEGGPQRPEDATELPPQQPQVQLPPSSSPPQKPTPEPYVPIPFNPEQPPPQPQEEEPKILCTICNKEEATKKLSVYVGPKHVDEVKQRLVQAVKDMKAGGGGV